MAEPNGRDLVIATIAITAVAVVSAITFCIMVMIGVRRRADPARFAAPWLKAASVFALLHVLMALATHSIHFYFIENPTTNNQVDLNLFRASGYISQLRQLFEVVAEGLIVVTLTSIAAGAHSVSRNSVATWMKLMRLGVMGMAAISICLGIAAYGIQLAIWQPQSEALGSPDLLKIEEDPDLLRAEINISAAARIIAWITSLAAAGLSVFVIGSGRKTITILLILANFLNVLATTWVMAYRIRWTLEMRFIPVYVSILQAVLGMWTTLGVILVCFFIMAKRAGGIWTVGAYGAQQGWAKEPRPSEGRSSY